MHSSAIPQGILDATVTMQWSDYDTMVGCNGHNTRVTAQWLRYDGEIAIGLDAGVTVQWPDTMNLLDEFCSMEST